MDYQLTKEQKATAINLAVMVECGHITPKKVLQAFQQDLTVAKAILAFWNEFNPMTKNVLNIVKMENGRQYLKACYQLNSKNHPEIEN